MANFTKEAIKATFLGLLEERPLNEITVKTLTEACGINRNSFYYHYRDLPFLLEEIIKEGAETIIRQYPSVTTIVQCFDAITAFALQRKKAIAHIYRSVNREVFERELMNVSSYFVHLYAEYALPRETAAAEDRENIEKYYKCVCFGLVIGWLNEGMTEEFLSAMRRMLLQRIDLIRETADLLRDQTHET